MPYFYTFIVPLFIVDVHSRETISQLCQVTAPFRFLQEPSLNYNELTAFISTGLGVDPDKVHAWLGKTE